MSSESKQATIIDAGKSSKLNVLGHVVNVMLTSAETQGDCFIFEAISPAGGVVPPHMHEHEDEYGYIAEGLYEIYLNGRTYEAQSGAVLYFPRHTAHGFRNIGSTPGKMIWVSTPGANVEPFFEELGALPADAPPDMEKVMGIFTKYDMQVFPLPEGSAMKMQPNMVEIGRALLDGTNARDLSKWESLLADDYTASYPSMRSDVDRQVAADYNSVILAAVPNTHFEIQRTVVNGDVVVYQWLASGTHTGPLALPSGTIPATDRPAAVPGVLIATVKEGKIVREEMYWNQMELLTQLGVM